MSSEFQGDDIPLTSTVGTPAFLAPEALTEEKQSFTGKVIVGKILTKYLQKYLQKCLQSNLQKYLQTIL